MLGLTMKAKKLSPGQNKNYCILIDQEKLDFMPNIKVELGVLQLQEEKLHFDRPHLGGLMQV